MDRSILKNGSPIVRVGQRWQSNDRRDLRPGYARVLEVVNGPFDDLVRCKVVTGRAAAVGRHRWVRLSAFLGGSRGFTLVADVPTPAELVTA